MEGIAESLEPFPSAPFGVESGEVKLLWGESDVGVPG